MTPGAHLLVGWLCTVPALRHARDRRIVALAGIAPDLDGLGMVADKLTSGGTSLFEVLHHTFGHNIFAALVIGGVASSLAKSQRGIVFVLAVLVVHLHFLCDVIGSRGPDGYQWPILYFYPVNLSFELTWSGQWELSAWQNQVIMVALFGACLVVLLKRRLTFLEVFSRRLEAGAFGMWRKYVSRNA
jgi:hypothetical protein